MLKKKNTEMYVKEIAKEFKVSQKAARSILIFAMKNTCRLIARGEDINFQHFGSIYFDKKVYGRYLAKGREEAIKKRNNNKNK